MTSCGYRIYRKNIPITENGGERTTQKHINYVSVQSFITFLWYFIFILVLVFCFCRNIDHNRRPMKIAIAIASDSIVTGATCFCKNDHAATATR